MFLSGPASIHKPCASTGWPEKPAEACRYRIHMTQQIARILVITYSKTYLNGQARVERNRESKKKLYCLSIQGRKTVDLYIKERERKPMPTAKSRNPKPRTSAGARVPPLHGAGEADGSRKPQASCPSPPLPKAKEATGPNPESTARIGCRPE